MEMIDRQAVTGRQKLCKGCLAFHPARNPVSNQNGSIILIAMMVLVIMTVIGLMSSQTVVTENFIIRNQGIYKQNINMVEAALMEGLQLFMQLDGTDPDLMDQNGSPLAWINNMNDPEYDTDWYTPNNSGRILDATNSMAINTPENLTDRGEAAAGNLRTAFVGWDIVTLPGGGSESLGIGSSVPSVWREGRLIGEYASRIAGADHGFGMMRMEIGVKRRIVIN